MTWQLASFALVGLALLIAAFWYERSRPPVKLVAVIATLAALAALGRDAFAAVPDVKPITAIVLVSGIAFGAGPGFAVGAVSALASNVLLGEGPWTPWQMIGWGLVGVIGGGLGALTARRLPTIAIAIACALAAEVFNLTVDLYTWTGTGTHTLSAFGVVLGSAFVFDMTHVAASFAFGLLFGGVLLRMLLRVRSRLHVTWSAPPAMPLYALLAVLLAPLAMLGTRPAVAHAAAARTATTAPAGGSSGSGGSGGSGGPGGGPGRGLHADISRALAYLESAQDGEGGFGAGPGETSSELYTAWAAIALAAGGRDPQTLARHDHSVLDALRAQAHTLEGAGDLERTILALRACGTSVHSLPGGDPVQRLLRYREHNGSFEGLVNLTAFAVLALRAAGDSPSAEPLASADRWLERQQNSDGGFGFAARSQGASDVDDSGAVLEALAASGVRSGAAVRRAVSYIEGAQNADGGLPEQPGGESNTQSTAWAVQGLDAVGQDPARITRHGRSPIAYLEGLMQANGSVRYSSTSSQTPVWVTAEALPALAGRPLPVD